MGSISKSAKYLWLVLAVMAVVVFGLARIRIPVDKIGDSNFRYTVRVLPPTMLTEVWDVQEKKPVFWYNIDTGPIPERVEKTSDGRWIVTLKATGSK